MIECTHRLHEWEEWVNFFQLDDVKTIARIERSDHLKLSGGQK
jgi:hypothetical protein